MKLNTRLVQVGKNSAELSDGTVIPARTVISTIGQRTTMLTGTESLPHTDKGLLVTDEYLHVKGQTHIWAGGDAAQVMHISGTPCPANALWAMMHGVRLGDNIARDILGKPLRKFTYRGLGQSASLGLGKGASELYGVPFKGWIGWILRFFFFMYFVPSRRQAIRILFDWMLLPIVGRYQTNLESVQENALAAKRSKETIATMEIPAIVLEKQ